MNDMIYTRRGLMPTEQGGRILTLPAGYEFVNAEASTYAAAMAVEPDDTRKELIDNFVGAIKTAGVFSKLDALYLRAAHTSQAALLNVINPALYASTAQGSPTFTADVGYSTNGSSSYVRTSFNPGGGGGPFKFLRNDACFGGWYLNNTAAGGVSGNGAENSDIGCRMNHALEGPNGRMYAMVNANATGALGGSTNNVGLFICYRNASNFQAGARNGVSVTTDTAASVAVTSQTFCEGSSNNGSSLFRAEQVAASLYGGALTLTEQGDLHTALSTYLTAVGAI
jgi:hypothetical protein